MSETVRITDIRLAGHCASGTRRAFESRGLDFRAFLRDGMDADAFRAAFGGLGDRIVQIKQAREAHG